MAPWIAAGMFWRRSLGVIPYSPKEAAARSPAAPWSQTADGTAFLGGIPCPSRERIIPATHISAAAFGHTGVSSGIFKGLPIGKGGDGSVPLQHQHAAVLTGKRQSSGLTIRANGLPLPQPEKFPIVRGQDRQTATPGVQNIYMFCHRVYTIGIQNQRGLKLLHQMTGAHIRFSASAQARSNENPVALVHIFQKNLKSRHRSRHSLLAFHCQHGPDLWRNRQERPRREPVRTAAAAVSAAAPVSPTLPAKICTFPKVPLCPSRFRTGRQ